MKQLTILLAILTLSTISFSQKLVKTYWDYRETKIQSEYYTDAYGNKNGSYKGYSEFGGILLQGTFKNNAPIGKWLEYYLDGKLHFIKIYTTPGNMNFDVIDGKIISFYGDGKTIEYERNFRNYELDGEVKEYNRNGTLIKEGKYVNGVFERTGESKRIYDEEQMLLKQKQKEQDDAIKKKNTELYYNIIPEADKAVLEKNHSKALKLYKSASELMENENYPKEKISELIKIQQSNSEFIKNYLRQQRDSLYKEFEMQSKEFKLIVIELPNINMSQLSDENVYKEYLKKQSYEVELEKMKENPCWKEYNWKNAQQCFASHRSFYETSLIAYIEVYLKYKEALFNEESKVNESGFIFNYDNVNHQFYTYDPNTLITNLKGVKNNYELGKSIKLLYNKTKENKIQIINLNEENKKKTLMQKYMIIYEDFVSKYNTSQNLIETITLITNINNISNKVISYYSQNTKDLEKKLKDTESIDQIKLILLGQ
jgi:antitoxin component YwqK of YwqJK toxin-antitoxin module